MKYLLAPLLLASVAMAAKMGMNIAGGSYNFGYDTGDAGGHSRVESGSGEVVSGSYSYVDANGDRRTVNYNAGPQGYQVSGDIGVDRKTAAAAAALAATAPKAPEAPAPGAAPVTSWGHAAASVVAPVTAWGHAAAPVTTWGHAAAPVTPWGHAPAVFGVPNTVASPSGYNAIW